MSHTLNQYCWCCNRSNVGDVGDGSDVGNVDDVAADTYIDTDDDDDDDDCVLVMVYKFPNKLTDFGYFPDARYEEPCVADVMPDNPIKVAERAAQMERRRNKYAPYRKAFKRGLRKVNSPLFDKKFNKLPDYWLIYAERRRKR